MSDIGKFFRESAKFMAKDRPDLWDEESAFNTLTDWHSYLNDGEEDGEISSGGFGLSKRTTDGYIEYELNRKITQFNIFPEEGETSIFDWTTGGALIDIGLDLPDELDED